MNSENMLIYKGLEVYVNGGMESNIFTIFNTTCTTPQTIKIWSSHIYWTVPFLYITNLLLLE